MGRTTEEPGRRKGCAARRYGLRPLGRHAAGDLPERQRGTNYHREVSSADHRHPIRGTGTEVPVRFGPDGPFPLFSPNSGKDHGGQGLANSPHREGTGRNTDRNPAVRPGKPGAGRGCPDPVRTLLLLLLLLAAPPALAALGERDRADIARVEAYLNDLNSFEARFTQRDSTGGESSGTVKVERPGRLRFEYAPPTPTLLVGTGGRLLHYDRDLDTTAHFDPDETFARLLLAEKVSLSGEIQVTDVRRSPGRVTLTAVRREAPGDGSIDVSFKDGPDGLTLEQWAVTDALGTITRVRLWDFETGVVFADRVFRLNESDKAAR